VTRFFVRLMGVGLVSALALGAAQAWALPHAEDGAAMPARPLVAVDDFHRHHWDRHGYPGDPWMGGRWFEGWFGGRYGWWWIYSGRYYWYDRPVYPYPPMESEVIVVQPPPPVVVVPPPPPAVVQPPPNTWYYCDNPAGYYPYVQNCMVPFRPVPAH